MTPPIFKSSIAKSRGITGYIGSVFAGAASAGMLIIATAHVDTAWLLLAYLAAVPLFMAGLGAGSIACLIAAATGVGGLLALSYIDDAFFYMITEVIPSVALIFLAMRARIDAKGSVTWQPEGRLLTMLVIYPCLIFLGIYMATLGQAGGLLALTTSALDQIGDQGIRLVQEKGAQVTPDLAMQIHTTLNTMAQIAPALMMCGWIIFTLITVAVAQALLLQQKWNLRPAFALANLRVPTEIIYAAAFAGLVASFAPAPYDYIGLNVALVISVPFFFVGLAIFHAAAAQSRAPTFALIIFYAVICLTVYLALAVACVGVVDQWIDFRKRFAERNITK